MSAEIPDSAVFLPGYRVTRRDINLRDGGIICYVSQNFASEVFAVPATHPSDSEFLCLYIKDFHLVVTVVYHPFWGNAVADEAALSVITHTIDSAFVKYGPHLRLLVCGDFNGLRAHYNVLTRLTSLSPVVDFPTRGANTLDQIFSNFAMDQKASSMPPFGRSDHLAVACRHVQLLGNHLPNAG